MKIQDLGLQEYLPVVERMRAFVEQRQQQSDDEIWLLEHYPVFTQGANGDPAHVLNAHDIPVITTDRGGQVTYHGPGQLIAYPLIDLRRAGIGVRQMVTHLEQAVVSMLSVYNVTAYARADAPGVYVDGAKIASLGLRVKRGCCYHGISINIAMDLTPFRYINPCGYADMQMIDLKSMGIELAMAEAKQHFVTALLAQMTIGNEST